MAFKDDVMFYLGTMVNSNKEDPIEEAMMDILEGESVCPECGEDPCSCDKGKKKTSKKSKKEDDDEEDEVENEDEDDEGGEGDASVKVDDEDDEDDEEAEDYEEEDKKKSKKKASRSTETGGGDDDDDGYQAHASTETECSCNDSKKKASENTEKVRSVSVKDGLDAAKKLGVITPADGFTREELAILHAICKNQKASVALADDHTSGKNGSVETSSLKEAISRYAFDNAFENKKDTQAANILKEMITEKKLSKFFKKNGFRQPANDFMLAEEMYIGKEPGAINKFKNTVKKYLK